MRTLLLATLIIASTPAQGDDVKPFTEEKRTELLKKLHSDYESSMQTLKSAIEKANALLSNANTAAEGRLKLAELQSSMARLKKDPQSAFGERLHGKSKIGTVGPLIHYRAVVVKNGDDGTLADVAHTDIYGNGVTFRVLFTPPIKGAKAKVSTNQSGLWLVAGKRANEGGGEVLVLQRVEFKPEELPGRLKPKK